MKVGTKLAKWQVKIAEKFITVLVSYLDGIVAQVTEDGAIPPGFFIYFFDVNNHEKFTSVANVGNESIRKFMEYWLKEEAHRVIGTKMKAESPMSLKAKYGRKKLPAPVREIEA